MVNINCQQKNNLNNFFAKFKKTLSNLTKYPNIRVTKQIATKKTNKINFLQNLKKLLSILTKMA